MEIFLIFLGYISAFLLGALCRHPLKEQRNKIHFYIARDKDGKIWLYIGKPIRGTNTFSSHLYLDFPLPCSVFNCLGLNKKNYDSLKWEDEPVEVFVNFED